MISNKLHYVEKFFLRSYSTSTLVQPGKFKVSKDTTIGGRLEDASKKWEFSDAISVPDQNNFVLTYKALFKNVRGLASGFIESNMKPQETILTNVPQGTELVIPHLAASKIGLKFLSVPPSSTFEQIGETLKSSSAKTIIIGDSNKRTMIEEARDFFPNLLTIGYDEYHRDNRFPSLKYIYTTGNRQEPGIDILSDIVLDLDLCKNTEVSPSSISTLTPVNGKLIAYTHSSLLNTGDSLVELLDLKLGERVSLSVPLHIGSSYPFYLGCLTNGSFVAISNDISVKEIISTIINDKCSVLFTSGKMLEDIIKSEEFNKNTITGLKKLVISGDVDSHVLKTFEEKVKCTCIVLSYVPTLPCQLTGVAFNSQGLGRVLPNIEAKVVDEKGNIVPRGQSGKLLTKGFHVNNNNNSEWLDTTLNVKMNSDGTVTQNK